MTFEKFLHDFGPVRRRVEQRFRFWIAPEREARDLDFGEIDGASLTSFFERGTELVRQLVGNDIAEMFRRNLTSKRAADQFFEDT